MGYSRLDLKRGLGRAALSRRRVVWWAGDVPQEGSLPTLSASFAGCCCRLLRVDRGEERRKKARSGRSLPFPLCRWQTMWRNGPPGSRIGEI